jgi:hypothetical protein
MQYVWNITIEWDLKKLSITRIEMVTILLGVNIPKMIIGSYGEISQIWLVLD